MIIPNLEISPNTYYTPDKVAVMLRLPKRIVRNLLESGLAQGIKVGRYWRILGSDLLQLSQREELQEADITRRAIPLSDPAFAKVWDNDEDSIYNKL